MGKNKYNAIIISDIQGETGPQGFQGPDGQECYLGTGDPNLLGLTLPDYSNDPVGTRRGNERIYYQDTVTGEVWVIRYFDGIPLFGTTWNKTAFNITGVEGSQGATAVDKIDIDLSINGEPSLYTLTPGLYSDTFTVATFLFPGTDVAPDFNKIQVLASAGNEAIAKFFIYDSNDTLIASSSFTSNDLSIITLNNDSVYPTASTYLKLKVFLVRKDPNNVTGPGAFVKMSYLNIR